MNAMDTGNKENAMSNRYYTSKQIGSGQLVEITARISDPRQGEWIQVRYEDGDLRMMPAALTALWETEESRVRRFNELSR